LEGKVDKELQRRTEFFLDLFLKLDELKDICGVIDVLSGLNDFHIRRLKDRIWVTYYSQ